LPESQNGFRKDISTVDAMFVSRMLASCAREKFVSIYKLFVDLTKAYDKVNRDILWKVLERIGVPLQLLGLIKGLLGGYQNQRGNCWQLFFRHGAVFFLLYYSIYSLELLLMYRKRN
jgi:hypothetical protein